MKYIDTKTEKTYDILEADASVCGPNKPPNFPCQDVIEPPPPDIPSPNEIFS